MSNHDNQRRGERKRTETGPRYESSNPGAGCNSTHVARGRRKWKRWLRRAKRREVRAAEPRLCPGCRMLDGEHDFGSTCTLTEPDAYNPYPDAP